MLLGKNKLAIILVVFLLFSASATGQPEKSYKYQFTGDLQENNVISDNQSITINYSISELNVESIVNEYGAFFRVSIPGHTSSSTPGKPELPVFANLITIPEGSEYKVKISDVVSTRIKPSGKKVSGILFPAQEGQTKGEQQNKPDFLIDKELYARRNTISSDTIKIEPLSTIRGKKLANLFVFPVRYNPRANILEVITSMKVEITFSYSGKAVSKSLLPESTLFKGTLGKSLINDNQSDVIPGYVEHPVKMVIITDTAFRKQLAPFFKWKTQKGYNLKILYKGTGAGLAGNTYTQLKDTLTKIYNAGTAADPPPEYLLIIGNVTRIPYYGTGNTTDMYYGEFDGNGDYMPEMFIGRLPVADTNDVKSVVNKIIQYEKFQFADTNKFYSRAIASAGVDAGYASYMNGQVKYAVDNYLTTANKISEFHFYYPQSIPVGDSIVKLINKGASFINYTGHGDVGSWLYVNFSTADTSKFKNKNMYPFVISNACQTARFSTATSLGNTMVLAKNKGAIGFIGCSNDSYWDEDFFWSVGACTPSDNPTYSTTGLGAYDRLFHTHGQPPSDRYFTMGQVTYAGNLAVSASTSSKKKYYWETYNLIGDPSIIPILGQPDHFNVSLPDTLPNGMKSLPLNIDPFAYVAVSHFDTLWDASYASPSGSVVLKMPGLSNDSCLVVITGQNKVPVIKTIHFSNVTNEFINLNSTSIDDSQGNGNGLADFGEKFYLNLKLSNLGSANASGLYAKLSSTSNLITINSDSAYIGTMPAKTDLLLSGKLSVTISGSVPNMGRITFKLMLKDDKNTENYTFDIVVHAPELHIISCTIDDSILGNDNLIADPGETFNLVFKVSNEGTSDISGDFKVSSQDADITVLEPNVKSGVLKFGDVTEIPIKVKLSETVSSGSTFSVSSTLDCNPYSLNRDFSFRVGKIRESFEAASFNIFPWINISPVPWFITSANSYDGNVSARSGAISDNKTTSLVIRTFYPSADSLSFVYKVSSEANYDFLIFKLNGTEVLMKSGEIDWTRVTIPVPKGLNKMEWIYSKDENTSGGSDCAWIDMIDFAKSGSVSFIKNDLQLARIVTPVQKDKYGQETVTVKVLNLGKDTLNQFNLAYEMNNRFPITQNFESKVIPFGDSVTVSFKTKADMSRYGIYDLSVYSYGNSDDYILNDTLQVKLENTEIKDSLSVFPNPFANQFTIFITLKNADKCDISISGISGAKMYDIEKSLISGKNIIVISDLRLSPALYYLNIRGTTFNKTIPILKINK